MSKLPVLDCASCGVCCKHMGYPAFNIPVAEQLSNVKINSTLSLRSSEFQDRQRWLELPQELKKALQLTIANYQKPVAEDGLDGPCTWWDPETKLCRHHQHRPQVCRDFEVGSVACLDWRKAYQIT